MNNVATKVDPNDKTVLKNIAVTSMRSKLVSAVAEQLADLIIDAASIVAEQVNGSYKVDIDDIKVEKKAGGSISDTALIKGIVLDKEVVHGGMPKKVSKARIALINAPLEIEKTEISAEIRINDPTQMKLFLDEENRMLKAMVDKIAEVNANVVICQKGIDDMAQHYLAKAGILAVRRVKESDMHKLAKATGARIVTNIEELTSKDLGSAALVEERKVETDKWVFIEGCKDPKAVSILVRGGSQRVVDEAERSLHDALMVVKDVLEKPAIVVGGGAPEAYIANKLREYSNKLSGREQLAVQKFADALETIPLVLAENAGMDPIDTLVTLRSKQEENEKPIYGINIQKGKIDDISKYNIIEPAAVKEQILASATEAACMILRIDDVIAASKSEMPQGQGMPGMGGMEGMPGMGGMPMGM